MKLHLEKCMRIVSDLVMYCHAVGSEDYRIDLIHEDGAYRIDVSCSLYTIDPMRLEELSDCLNLPRQREIEQNYWELSGDSEIESELTLVGMMVDTAEVTHKDGILRISAYRKLD